MAAVDQNLIIRGHKNSRAGYSSQEHPDGVPLPDGAVLRNDNQYRLGIGPQPVPGLWAPDDKRQEVFGKYGQDDLDRFKQKGWVKPSTTLNGLRTGRKDLLYDATEQARIRDSLKYAKVLLERKYPNADQGEKDLFDHIALELATWAIDYEVNVDDMQDYALQLVYEQYEEPAVALLQAAQQLAQEITDLYYEQEEKLNQMVKKPF